MKGGVNMNDILYDKIKSVNMKMPYNSDLFGDYPQLIDKVVDVGCNYISFCPTLDMADKDSNEITIETPDKDLKRYINYAKGKGLKIILKPHMCIVKGHLGGSSNIQPTNVKAWINSLKECLIHFVKLLGDDISILSICNECTHQTNKNKENWIELINAIRDLNPNIKLTLATTDIEIGSNVLYPYVDYLGANLYVGLDGTKDTPIKELKKSIYNDFISKEDYLTELFHLSKKYNKPILFTEVGCLPYEESLHNPARWNYPEKPPVVEEVQEVYYEVVLSSYLNAKNVLGVSLWDCVSDYSFFGKKAENIVRKFYGDDYSMIDNNLPTDSCVNDMLIYHEGNHTDKGNPHNNYISKYACNYTLNTKSDNANNFVKIATIKYESNNNVAYRYIIELFSTNITAENKIILSCGGDLAKTNCKFVGSSHLEVGVKMRTSGSNNIIDIYLKINDVWTKMFYRVYFARCLDYLNLYNEESAYKSIELFNEQPFSNSSEFSSDVIVNYDRPMVCRSIISTSKNISANGTIELNLIAQNMTSNSYLLSCTPINLDNNFSYGNISIKDNGTLSIKIRNLENVEKTLPEIKWNVVYK